MSALLGNIEVVVFDAYGTLFDFNAAAEACRDTLGDDTDRLSALWREKQLQYTWLRSLMGRYEPFHEVTGDALDFAMATLGIEDAALWERLMSLYRRVEAFPEVSEVLRQLNATGRRLAILSNGTPEMIEGAAAHAGIAELLDALLSVEEVGVYKPHPSVYALAVERFEVTPKEICFVSSNAWDAVAAATFGMRVVWCNRYRQARERLSEEPDCEIDDLAALPSLLAS